MNDTLHIGFLLFPNITQLDLTGPIQILCRLPDTQVHLVWKDTAPVRTDVGFEIVPTCSFGDSPQFDVLCVPGGFGICELMTDGETLDFLRRQAARARYVTSVCNGSLVLGAAGLLDGYRAACHWMYRDWLPRFGAEPVAARIVRDRNRLSGGGVTARIDFALMLAAELAGEDIAKRLQLNFEYDPQPPFDCGTPERAGPALTEQLRVRMAPRLARVKECVEAAALY